MRRFTELLSRSAPGKTDEQQVEYFADYLGEAPERDAMWTVAHLLGDRPVRGISVERLKEAVAEFCDLPDWLVAECITQSGNACEAMALLLDTAGVMAAEAPQISIAEVFEEILPAVARGGASCRVALHRAWRSMRLDDCVHFHKLITGRYRQGKWRAVLVAALASHLGLEESVIEFRLRGFAGPNVEAWRNLRAERSDRDSVALVYPHPTARVIREVPPGAGELSEWFVEWYRPGAYVRLVKRGGEVLVWEENDTLMEDLLPNWISILDRLPDGTVLEGVLIVRAELAESMVDPLRCMLRDILEYEGTDLSEQPFGVRRRVLEELWNRWDRESTPVRMVQGDLFDDESNQIPSADPFELECGVVAEDWDEIRRLVKRSAMAGNRGVRCTRKSALATEDFWWWKPEPHRVDVVLLGLRRRRANDELILGAWRDGELVPVATLPFVGADGELEELHGFVAGHTLRRRGPIIDLEPIHVFRMEFEWVSSSERHQSGIILEAARLLEWRRGLDPSVATRLNALTLLRESLT